MSFSWKATAWLAAGAAALTPFCAVAQDKNQVREQARSLAAQLRNLGEPKDRCALGAEVQNGIVIVRADPGSVLMAGDKLLALKDIDMINKSASDAVAVLRATAADATIQVAVSRADRPLRLNIACTNSRPKMEAYLLGLDQAATGKFDDCVSTFSSSANLGFAGASMKASCAALAKKPDPRVVGEANFEALSLAIQDAIYVPSSRARVSQQLRVVEASITQSIGAERFQQLIAMTQNWPGDEQLFARSEPDWALFRRKGEQSLRARLIDPDSARIEWPHGFIYGTWKPVLSKRMEGYWTCGLINARNRMGGYTGSTAFVVVMDNAGEPLFTDLGSGQDFDILSAQCANSVKLLPPPPAALAGILESNGGPVPSLGDELQKLAALRASGALTEAEFQAAKQKLLGAPKP